ncbi:hypothetical protein ESCO_002082 [Escovopsis weberi]|uniref:Cerato-platanin n=1 Tax=Escovopsis weberi TaxID=150374 RepID=A0A0M9VWV6_ESCWE|nr:hypothetical protein ESCO_002082 [Escovopsis weberi]
MSIIISTILAAILAIWTHARPAISGSSSSSSSSGSSGTYSVYATPHASYSSSIGVPGCKVNTDRIAYWPAPVSCDDICVSLRHAGRELLLLRVDQSSGAHDISFDAFNFLLTGHPATERPVASGPVAMQARDVPADWCAGLLRTGGRGLPLSAANSINFLASCLAAPNGSWVADNHVLYNICDPLCTLGRDEVCSLEWPAQNQPACPHTLGLLTPLKGDPVWDIAYPSGERVLAGSAPIAPPSTGTLMSRTF